MDLYLQPIYMYLSITAGSVYAVCLNFGNSLLKRHFKYKFNKAFPKLEQNRIYMYKEYIVQCYFVSVNRQKKKINIDFPYQKNTVSI